ncbi:MAG: archaemetzincin [Planctomycetia bacterium]|nr:archaemetzincin [Planctomycetia bacterium]
MRQLIFVAVFLCSGTLFSHADAQSTRIPPICQKIEPLYSPFPTPQPGDWQYVNREPGQTFAQYVRAKPVVATKKRSILYVQTLGETTDAEREMIEISCDYLRIFYNLRVKELPSLPLETVPSRAQRRHPETGEHQLNATYIIQSIMIPRLPEDAAAYLMFTTTDLWPGDDWNFCFGLASYQARSGVWSLARHGDASDPDERTQYLRRTLRIAAHETGHMFSIYHCIEYRCGMNGSNSLEEADGIPLEFCPQCLAKLRVATKIHFMNRWKKLLEFYEKHGLEPEAEFVRQCLED